MADTEEPQPQFNSLKERIAALNQQKNFNSSAAVAQKAKPPPPPPGRPATERSQTTPVDALRNGTAGAKTPEPRTMPTPTPTIPQRPGGGAKPPPLPRRDTQSSVASEESQSRGVPPPLPNRTATFQQPAPPQRPTGALSRKSTQSDYLSARRGSTSSELSQRSVGSDGSSRMLAPAFDQASLPALPPSRRELEAKAQQEATQKSAQLRQTVVRAKPEPAPIPSNGATPRPSLPPRLPSRPATVSPARTPTPSAAQPQDTARNDDPARAVANGALKKAAITGFGSGKRQPSTQSLPPAPSRPRDDGAPPPVPLSSRPSAAQVDAASTRIVAMAEARNVCLHCRDWSEPDRVAALFPRASLPRNDPVGHLARGLCDPFPSYTDKARAIFTWFHHNIFYDTVSFFGKCVKHHTVEETIFSGLAVCQGYSEVYAAIAKRAGLECVMVVGHGKGFGHTPLKKGERPPPPKPDGHAWNAVRIDGGAWQLLDACWGAGHLDTSTNTYKQKFSPWEFTRTNEQFGVSHFPRDGSQQFRGDGRVVSWEEYITGGIDGEKATVYSNCYEEGIWHGSVQPREKDVAVYSGQVVRFCFSKVCEHWKSEVHGKGAAPLLLLSIHGADGRKDEMVPMETDGYWHWIDVHARDLGAPGQKVQVAMVDTMDGRDARGVTKQQYLSSKGKVGMSFSFLMGWDLV